MSLEGMRIIHRRPIGVSTVRPPFQAQQYIYYVTGIEFSHIILKKFRPQRVDDDEIDDDDDHDDGVLLLLMLSSLIMICYI
jgi:hypothetical protein